MCTVIAVVLITLAIVRWHRRGRMVILRESHFLDQLRTEAARPAVGVVARRLGGL